MQKHDNENKKLTNLRPEMQESNRKKQKEN